MSTHPQLPRSREERHAASDAPPGLNAASDVPAYFRPFERIAVPVHSMGPDGLLVAVNDAWEAYTGYSRAEAIGHTFADFLDPASALLYRQKAVPELVETVPEGESRSLEYRLVKRSGDVADLVLTARAERDPATGRFLHSLSVLTDITARTRAEAALRHAQKLEALGNLTSGVAHDFNNLLTIILGNLQLLVRRLPPDDTRAARLVDGALQGATRGAALTARLLAFARQQDLVPREIDPRTLLDTLRPMLAQLLGPGIEIEEDLPPGLWTLQADPNQIELALLNLASNARDAMPAGGRLRLAARNAWVDAADPIFLDRRAHPALPAGAYVVLSVCDTGCGMDEKALARATDPFFTTKGVGKGTGLGLSMVHGFAEQSGGALSLSSRPDLGTTVEIWLPRSVGEVDGAIEAEPADGAGVAAAANGRGLRILVVDDDPLVLASTTTMLEELGYEPVRAVPSGAEALDVLHRDGDFDLLLTDYMMPGMSGVELARRARALHPALPVLLASGFAELDGLAGVTWPRLRKPFGLADLSAALAGVSAPRASGAGPAQRSSQSADQLSSNQAGK